MRTVSAAEAVAGIRSHDQLFLQSAAAMPDALIEALCVRAGELEDVKMIHLHGEGPCMHLKPELAKSFRHKALFIGPSARDAVNEGRAEYIPVFLSDVPALFSRGLLPLDAALLNVSPPDQHGFCSLGTSVDGALSAARAAKVVIAQINRSMPRTLGDSFVHVSQITFGVEVDRPPHSHAPGPISAVEKRIGQLIAELVQDGATLQLGIGAIPAATALALGDKKDLGIHTEMFTDVVVDLVEKGVVTGARKQVNPGKIVATFMLGTERLYKFVHDNPMVEMRPANYTNDSAVIRRFKRMVAINSAIEIDLTGQVCADSIGTRMYSGVGGQMDFIRGAALAEEGRAIIALPSTAQGGKATRLVATLKEGAGVVTTRAHVHTVVTEHGIAELHGRSIPERARALIGIAAPEFRESLTREARRLRYL